MVASSADLTIRCARCGHPLRRSDRPVDRSAGLSQQEPSQSAPRFAGREPVREMVGAPPDFVELEDWEFEEAIRQAQQSVQSVLADSPMSRRPSPMRLRTDAAHVSASPGPTEDTTLSEPAEEVAVSAVAASPEPQASVEWQWVILALGLGVFVCGASLMAFSLASQQTLVWQLGLPMVLGGLVAVLVAVIWQLDIVWRSNRAASVALHAMDEQLRAWRQTLDQRPADRSGESSFQRHVREGAPLSVMLRDVQQR